uniref:C2H2-type domain-containing protein n=1 Tax=Anopheles coluzzii TaxID=1518534 RepID=A0A8W7PS26_ANOCL
MVGFKEFVKYLETYGPEQDLEILDYRTTSLEHPRPKPTGLSMLEDCLDYLKLVTRRYARRQLQWIRNRFLSDIGREVPPIYALDTGNVDHWKVQVSDPALAIIDAMKSGQPSPVPCVPKIATDRERLQTERTFRCETCQRVFIGEHQWQIHIHSKKHRKMTKRSKSPSTDQQTGPELKAISPPNASPSEKKICVPASNQTTGSRIDSHRGVNRCAMPSDAP